jgi:hypothetical protein
MCCPVRKHKTLEREKRKALTMKAIGNREESQSFDKKRNMPLAPYPSRERLITIKAK